MTTPSASPAPLPIEPALPRLIAALRRTRRAVLEAPPGAGKTTRVPLALLDSGLIPEGQRIVMLEPRRLAARAAAERMAETLGETAGGRIGYRMRGAVRVSQGTRIEVVTEGVLTRMLQAQPDLPGVACVIFDEFHERSLNADLGLALCLEVAGALREDLHLLAMSATLDAGPVADLMQAPLVTARGQGFPVGTHWLDVPPAGDTRRLDALADLVLRAERESRAMGGGLLVFLPGEREIRRTAALLAPRLPAGCCLHPLYGALPFKQQQAAIAPARTGRKIVLATSIAETSLTLPDIRVVVDAGLARRARFDPGSGMSRLVTEPASRAEITQRRGRAGRVAEGRCYRLWSRGQEGALPEFPPPEIAVADLAPLALDLAEWGADAAGLSFLTPPPDTALAGARRILAQLGALDGARITDHGRALSAVPLHPRLAHMLMTAGRDAAMLAALLAARDPLRGAPADLALRLAALNGRHGPARQPFDTDGAALDRIRSEAARLRKSAPASERPLSIGAMAALAYPDRIARRRPGEAPRYLLSGGKGARLAPDDPLAGAPWLVATDLDGDPSEARIRTAAPITEGEIREILAARIAWIDRCEWSGREGRVIARRQERLDALVLGERPWRDAPEEALKEAMLEGVRDLGLPMSGAAARLAARVELLRAKGADLPDFSQAGLMASLDSWLRPFLGGIRSAADWKQFDILLALRARLDHEQQRLLDHDAPAHFTTPLGRRVPIDYTPEGPQIALRLQELFGVTRHPEAAGMALRIALLSPAGREVQVTRDLPGFWAGSYRDVRKDMRARYPKHPWPEDPARAAPTTRAKPRR
ncbi:ATP-dependent helicase HrpB [Pontibaca methylaminivorans]|uniref:ATP-dependent helicase HrpB n=1 Tax=Pontibaca methylaminivorans TaxID=515897 RepID=UPI002FDB4907